MSSETYNHIKAYRVVAYAYFDNKCCNCQNKLRLQLHHKNGDSSNNNIDNLILLCSACHGIEHSQLSKNKVVKKIKCKVHCKKCGYSWEYNGNNHLVSCPSCGNKVKIREIDGEEK